MSDKLVVTPVAPAERRVNMVNLPARQRGLMRDVLRRLFANKAAVVGLVIIVLFTAIALLAPFIMPYDPSIDGNLVDRFKSPSTEHIMGTDSQGRDLFRRVVHGSRISLRIGLVAVAVSCSIGTILGLLAGFLADQRVILLPAMWWGYLRSRMQTNQPGWMRLISSILWLLTFGWLGWTLASIWRFLAPSIAGRFLQTAVYPVANIATLGMLNVGLDSFIMRLMDIVLAFPGLLLAIAMVAIRGPSLDTTMIVIGLVGIPGYARVMRSVVLSLRERDYVMAARSIGSGSGRIMFKHIFPNSLSPIIVQATLGIAGSILTAAALGFLGLGATPPAPEWGAMISDSIKYLERAPYLVFFPGLAIMFTVLGFNLLGDGLRDALDPQLKGR